jgi:hypothetical protein
MRLIKKVILAMSNILKEKYHWFDCLAKGSTYYLANEIFSIEYFPRL